MAPPSPTAQPCAASLKVTPQRAEELPEVCLNQPPSPPETKKEAPAGSARARLVRINLRARNP